MQNIPYRYTFTVLTPTYNRANLLPRVYQSLVHQTYKDFEWVIVDDGSTDNTETIIKSFREEADFSIRYIWKSNGGVHTAVNKGVSLADGKFFAILDSDDWYVDDALEKMLEFWNSIEDTEKSKYSGVCGLCAYKDGKIVGTKFPSDVWDSDDFEAKNVYRYQGDKIGFKRTDVMKQFPFPEDVGNFVNESTVWNRIGLAYSTRFVNRIFAIKEYQTDGLTDNSRIYSIRNPKAKILFLSELLNCGRHLPTVVSSKTAINFLRFSLHARVPIREIYRNFPNKIIIFPYFTAALLLVIRDQYLLHRHIQK